MPEKMPDDLWTQFLSAHDELKGESTVKTEGPAATPEALAKVDDADTPKTAGRVRTSPGAVNRAKAGWSSTHAGASKALDAGAKAVRPFTSRYLREADRRAELRTPEALDKRVSAEIKAAEAKAAHAVAQAGWKQAVAANGRFASASDVARINMRTARAKLKAASTASKAAKAACPTSLGSLAVKGHLTQGCVGTVLALSQGSPWPLMASGAAAAAWYGALLLARRTPREAAPAQVDDGMTREERELMRRLDTSWWVEHAENRGLGGTVPGKAGMGKTGPTAAVRLDGKWDLDSFKSASAKVRTLLGVKKGTRMRISEGETSQWVVVTLLTRSAAGDVEWSPDKVSTDPERMSLGVDTETGEEVFLDFRERLMVCGASGTGKSWALRPLIAHAHKYGAVLFCDGKGEEATVLAPVLAVANEGEEVLAAVRGAHNEMNRRKLDMRKRGLSVWDGEQLTFIVDEGQVILALIKAAKKEAEELLQKLIELSSLGRSRGIVMWWCSQKVVMSGSAPGVHNLIAPNLLQRVSLRVADEQESRTALDDCSWYAPHKIPEGRDWKGHCYVKGRGPHLVRAWTLRDHMIPQFGVKRWDYMAAAGEGSTAKAADVEARKAIEAAGDPAPAPELSPQDRVRAYKAAHPDASYGAIAKATGVPKSSVERYLKK